MRLVLVTTDAKSIKFARRLFRNSDVEILTLDQIGTINTDSENEYGDYWAIYTCARSVLNKIPTQYEDCSVLAIGTVGCFLFPCGTRKFFEPTPLGAHSNNTNKVLYTALVGILAILKKQKPGEPTETTESSEQ